MPATRHFGNDRIVHYKNITLDLTQDLNTDIPLVVPTDEDTRFHVLDVILEVLYAKGTPQTNPQIQIRAGVPTGSSTVVVSATAITPTKDNAQTLTPVATSIPIVTGGKELFARISTLAVGQATASRERTSNVATIVFGAAHGLAVGDVVRVRDLGTGYDGLKTVLSVPSSTSITFASVGDDEAVTTDTDGDILGLTVNAHVIGLYF